MKKSKLIAALIALLLAVASLSLVVFGSDVIYDSENDPLISLSYLTGIFMPEIESKLAPLTSEVSGVSQTVEKLTEDLESATKKIEELTSRCDQLSAAMSASNTPSEYAVVYMLKGQRIKANNPCELILRSGSAVVVSEIENGLNDTSDGTELLGGVSVPLYHGMLIPRGGDGRGIEITSENAYVMVRGDYEIVK